MEFNKLLDCSLSEILFAKHWIYCFQKLFSVSWCSSIFRVPPWRKYLGYHTCRDLSLLRFIHFFTLRRCKESLLKKLQGRWSRFSPSVLMFTWSVNQIHLLHFCRPSGENQGRRKCVYFVLFPVCIIIHCTKLVSFNTRRLDRLRTHLPYNFQLFYQTILGG